MDVIKPNSETQRGNEISCLVSLYSLPLISQRERFTMAKIIKIIKLVDSANVCKEKNIANTSTMSVMIAVAKSGVCVLELIFPKKAGAWSFVDKP